jgi:hypothetical protein
MGDTGFLMRKGAKYDPNKGHGWFIYSATRKGVILNEEPLASPTAAGHFAKKFGISMMGTPENAKDFMLATADPAQNPAAQVSALPSTTADGAWDRMNHDWTGPQEGGHSTCKGCGAVWYSAEMLTPCLMGPVIQSMTDPSPQGVTDDEDVPVEEYDDFADDPEGAP